MIPVYYTWHEAMRHFAEQEGPCVCIKPRWLLLSTSRTVHSTEEVDRFHS